MCQQAPDVLCVSDSRGPSNAVLCTCNVTVKLSISIGNVLHDADANNHKSQLGFLTIKAKLKISNAKVTRHRLHLRDLLVLFSSVNLGCNKTTQSCVYFYRGMS